MEDEIEVGEYIRTNNGIIGKYVKYTGIHDSIETNSKWIGFDIEKDIVKHSKNIIDLIEEGDYVNGVEVQYVYGYDEDGNDLDGLGICEVDGDYAYYKYLEDITIHSIITKEQINQIEFIVKE